MLERVAAVVGSVGVFFIARVWLSGDPLTEPYVLGHLFEAMMWGAFVWPVLILVDRRFARKSGVASTWGTLGTPQHGELAVDGDPEDVLHRAQDGVARIARVKAVVTDAGRGLIEARTAVSLWSWGERVRVEIRLMEAGRVRVRVESRAAFPLTLIDYGRNAENVPTVLQALSSDADALAATG
jgi:hypothetical protein